MSFTSSSAGLIAEGWGMNTISQGSYPDIFISQVQPRIPAHSVVITLSCSRLVFIVKFTIKYVHFRSSHMPISRNCAGTSSYLPNFNCCLVSLPLFLLSTLKDWGESASELMIVKKKQLQKTVHRTLLFGCFYLLYTLYSNLSPVYCS